MFSVFTTNHLILALSKNISTLFLSLVFLEVFFGVPHDVITSFEIGAMSGLCRVFITLLTLRGQNFKYRELFAIPLGAIVASVFRMHIVPGGSVFGIVLADDIANWFLWGQAAVWIFGFLMDGANSLRGGKKE